MIILSKKLAQAFGGLTYYCEGCKQLHTVWTKEYHRPEGGPQWEWDGNTTKPTFNPSIRVSYGSSGERCHCFLRHGQIQYLSDCTHELAGQTIDLPDLPDWFLEGEVMPPE